MIKIAITGGICSGKSSVCRLVEMLGYSVYYCDLRGAHIIDNDIEIREAISAIFGDMAYQNGRLDRSLISSKVFSNRELLSSLNRVTHPKVVDDFKQWCMQKEQLGEKMIFIESAILFESGLDCLVDRIITVSSLNELRVRRCIERDRLPREQIERRIASQMSDSERIARGHYNIISDDKLLVIPQVIDTIDSIKQWHES